MTNPAFLPHPFIADPIRRYDGRGGTYAVCMTCYGGTVECRFPDGSYVHPAYRLWLDWYAMEDSRPADRDSAEYRAWTAECARLYGAAKAAESAVS